MRAIVRAVPRGRVVTYGQAALLAGKPHGAREVGWIAHAGGDRIPWQRVVNRYGGLARGYTGGPAGHRLALRRDGVVVGPHGRVSLRKYQWWPDLADAKRLGLRPDVIATLTAATRAPGRSSRSARAPRRRDAPP